MKPKKIAKVFIATADLVGFYGAKIKEGTLLYPYKPEEVKPVYHAGSWHWRYVFDTIPRDSVTPPNVPENNKRKVAFFSKKQWDIFIRPLTPDEIKNLEAPLNKFAQE